MAKKRKPTQRGAVLTPLTLARMAAPRDSSQNVCPNCVSFNAPDGTCRRNAPAPELTGNPKVIWPAVTASDWCADGWSVAGGWYDQRPITRSF